MHYSKHLQEKKGEEDTIPSHNLVGEMETNINQSNTRNSRSYIKRK